MTHLNFTFQTWQHYKKQMTKTKRPRERIYCWLSLIACFVYVLNLLAEKKLSIQALKLFYCHGFTLSLLLLVLSLLLRFRHWPLENYTRKRSFLRIVRTKINIGEWTQQYLLLCSLNKWINQRSIYTNIHMCTVYVMYMQCKTTNQFHYSLIIFSSIE